MGTLIRAIIIDAEQLAAEHLTKLLDETGEVQVVGIATHGDAGIRLCDELCPQAVFLDVNLPGKDGVSLAAKMTAIPQPPRLVFTTANPDRAAEAFRLEAVDYLLKPLDPIQVVETVKRLLLVLRPVETERMWVAANSRMKVAANGELYSGRTPFALWPVKDVAGDKIQLLSRREIAAVLRKGRRTWIHTVREEFPTYCPLGVLRRWLGGRPFIKIARHAVVNEWAIEYVSQYSDGLYRIQLRDRSGTDIDVSQRVAFRLTQVQNLRRDGNLLSRVSRERAEIELVDAAH